MFWIILFLVLYDQNLNCHLDTNLNCSPIVHFRFLNVVLRNQKSKKEKGQCSQNFDLNPTRGKANIKNKLQVQNGQSNESISSSKMTNIVLLFILSEFQTCNLQRKVSISVSCGLKFWWYTLHCKVMRTQFQLVLPEIQTFHRSGHVKMAWHDVSAFYTSQLAFDYWTNETMTLEPKT